MVDVVGGGGGLARAAIEAALRSQGQTARRVEERVAAELARTAAPKPAAAFADSLSGAVAEGVQAVGAALGAVDRLPERMVTGEVADFHELAARLKQSELTFKFALEVRNKLIDAYRETMRMSV